ncbi:hypothetical protein VC83_02847 [Pseudogymnoascus destructans]|uniref:Condensation domain-containing protein n=2 Tax=Pseudogymnoascus destructans TaxID=655981 RepID=L8FVQ1_PSED2|nr:uncharacterized protein VC83_02847 [Pseudogymnoascus destructans]ELR04962.1 hypothetical protein GMDG_00219 [Pseudogymnoascus destructans 20631-21]OAF59870.1 hypothetical protein VC83_02847 [Pseudogymnoascus destructans]
MPWQETISGRYEREFGSVEQFYRQIAAAGAVIQKQQFLISCSIRLRELPSVAELQRAWKALRFLHPQIAAEADESGFRLTYTVPSPESIRTWMQETFIVDAASNSANNLYTCINPAEHFQIYILPLSGEILFRTPHWRIDGTGLRILQNAFLQILADGPPNIIFDGTEVVRLAPSLNEAAFVPREPTPQTSKASDAELDAFEAGPPSIPIATLPNILPTSPQRYRITFSADVTERIISSCKARGITVTTAAHSALVLAMQPCTQDNSGPSTRDTGRGKYTGITALDLRKYLSAPWNGPQSAVSLYHTGLPFSIDLNEHRDFNAIAAEMKAIHTRNLRNDESQNAIEFLASYVRKALGTLSVAPEDPLKAPAYQTLSSLGVVNNYLHSKRDGKAATVEIEDWWLSVEIINRVLATTLWTWDGQLNLSVSYNGAFYERSFVEQFIDGWGRELTTALGVEEHIISADISATAISSERAQCWIRRTIALVRRLFCH